MQGKESDHAPTLLNDAKALEAAGAFAIVLEAIPAELAKTITDQLTIPTIGIGAGPHCDGQVLVLYDLLGLFDDFVPKFVKPYAHLKADALQALRRYKEEVEEGKFPSDNESLPLAPLAPSGLRFPARSVLIASPFNISSKIRQSLPLGYKYSD